MTKTFLYITVGLLIFSCNAKEIHVSPKLVNSAHLDSLYQEIQVEGTTVGVIHIYSEYPDYKWVGDSDEGIACIDDAARAAIFYVREYHKTGKEEYLHKTKMLLEFTLKLQSSNGYFFNFVWRDGSINKEFKTSVAESGWWSWRALWVLSETYPTIISLDNELSARMKSSMDKLVANIKQEYPGQMDYQNISGYKRPTWLPYGTASDQAALLVIGLTNYLKYSKDAEIKKVIANLCEGMMSMQEGDKNEFPYAAFMSWENTWHGWGNSQAYALLLAGDLLQNNEFIAAATREVKYFYPYMIQSGYYNEFKLKKNSDPEFIKYSQIAYELRPMIFATLKVYELTNDSVYLQTAVDLSGWFFGNNPANRQVYFPATGICFDGINSETELNKNSGAESTIEALLALQMIENYESALQVLMKRIKSN